MNKILNAKNLNLFSIPVRIKIFQQKIFAWFLIEFLATLIVLSRVLIHLPFSFMIHGYKQHDIPYSLEYARVCVRVYTYVFSGCDDGSLDALFHPHFFSFVLVGIVLTIL